MIIVYHVYIYFGQQVNQEAASRGPGKFICLFKKNVLYLYNQ